MTRPMSVFEDQHDKVWKYRYNAELNVYHMSGGVPNDPKVIKGWLMSRLGGMTGDKEKAKDERLLELVERTAKERGISLEDAIDRADINVNGFKQDRGGLYYEGRCMKAALKEFFSIAQAGGHFLRPNKDGKPTNPSYGTTNKGLLSFVAEHIHVPAEAIELFKEDGTTRYTEPDYLEQRFVSTFRGQGISYTDTLNHAVLRFVVEADWDFSDLWPIVWQIGESNGLGAMRSQGSGKFTTTMWEPIEPAASRRRRSA